MEPSYLLCTQWLTRGLEWIESVSFLWVIVQANQTRAEWPKENHWSQSSDYGMPWEMQQDRVCVSACVRVCVCLCVPLQHLPVAKSTLAPFCGGTHSGISNLPCRPCIVKSRMLSANLTSGSKASRVSQPLKFRPATTSGSGPDSWPWGSCPFEIHVSSAICSSLGILSYLNIPVCHTHTTSSFKLENTSNI